MTATFFNELQFTQLQTNKKVIKHTKQHTNRLQSTLENCWKLLLIQNKSETNGLVQQVFLKTTSLLYPTVSFFRANAIVLINIAFRITSYISSLNLTPFPWKEVKTKNELESDCSRTLQALIQAFHLQFVLQLTCWWIYGENNNWNKFKTSWSKKMRKRF